MQPLIVTCLQSKLAEVQFEFMKIEEMIHIYQETCENASERYQLVYTKAAAFSNKEK